MAGPEKDKLTKVTIYTDGACSGNPGPGGYGALLVSGRHRREISGAYRLTTNNRMEIMALIEALKRLKYRCDIAVYTDSQYLANSINKGWARKWRANGWKRNAKDKAENPDLWAELLDLLDQHVVEVHWVRGHAGHEENELCDRLAVAASQQKDLPDDPGYRPE